MIAPCLLIRAARRSSPTAPARRAAAVVEPNGITVPAPADHDRLRHRDLPRRPVCEDGRCEIRLQSYFDAQGEAISETADASTDPGVFLPLCDFAATLVLSESQAPGRPRLVQLRPPAPTARPRVYQIGRSRCCRRPDHHQHRRAHRPRLRGRPDRLRAAQEPRPAACCRASTTPSTAQRRTARRLHDARLLEDGAQLPDRRRTRTRTTSRSRTGKAPTRTAGRGTTATSTTRSSSIDGVTCDGGGEPCDTGMPGVCAQGVTECQVGAGIICKPAVIKSAEKCDNLDNDCNGMVDDGDGLCPSRASSAARASASRSATTASSLRGRAAVRHRRAVQRSALRHPRLPGRAGLPGRHLRRRLPGRHLPARARVASSASASIRARACRALAPCARRARASRPAAAARAAPARCARWAARSMATASTPAATR